VLGKALSICLRAAAVIALVFLPVTAPASTCVPESPSSADSQAVTIRAVGDIVLGTDWPASNYPADFEVRAQAGMRRVLGQADVVFGNLEGALTNHNVSPKKPNGNTVFAFRMPPRFAGLLRGAGFNVLAIANNHTLDFGERGLADTLTHLSRAEVVVIGETDKIVLQKVRDVTLAWIGFSYLDRHNNVRDLDKLAELVLRARPLADLVIVSMQAGAEGSDYLRLRDQEETFLGEKRGNTFAFARKAIDLGADLVIGHGPHVVRGIECYKGKLIAYSLGNFVGYNALSIKRAAAVTIVLEVKLSKQGQTLGFDVTPLKFNEERFPQPDPDALASYLINDLSRLAPLNGTVLLPVPEAGRGRYLEWLKAEGLGKIIGE
jgi:poly-gamma-glutamate capsule biosynthesis protein CapA/YwtB (metallophosphatase superfamily)